MGANELFDQRSIGFRGQRRSWVSDGGRCIGLDHPRSLSQMLLGLHEVRQSQQVRRAMLALELFAPFLDGVWAAHIEQRLEQAARANAVHQLVVPGGELVCLDQEAGVKGLGVRPLDVFSPVLDSDYTRG